MTYGGGVAGGLGGAGERGRGGDIRLVTYGVCVVTEGGILRVLAACQGEFHLGELLFSVRVRVAVLQREACVRACVRACMRACMHVCMRACMSAGETRTNQQRHTRTVKDDIDVQVSAFASNLFAFLLS